MSAFAITYKAVGGSRSGESFWAWVEAPNAAAAKARVRREAAGKRAIGRVSFVDVREVEADQ